MSLQYQDTSGVEAKFFLFYCCDRMLVFFILFPPLFLIDTEDCRRLQKGGEGNSIRGYNVRFQDEEFRVELEKEAGK